ncbi:MAG: hypothetical protein ACRCTS_07255 [Fusobacteriaceae bacterium]
MNFILKNYTVEIDEFRELLNIPDSYKISDIDKQILKKIICSVVYTTLHHTRCKKSYHIVYCKV